MTRGKRLNNSKIQNLTERSNSNLLNLNVITDKIENMKVKQINKNSANPIFPKFSRTHRITRSMINRDEINVKGIESQSYLVIPNSHFELFIDHY